MSGLEDDSKGKQWLGFLAQRRGCFTGLCNEPRCSTEENHPLGGAAASAGYQERAASTIL